MTGNLSRNQVCSTASLDSLEFLYIYRIIDDLDFRLGKMEIEHQVPLYAFRNAMILSASG
jgi:hypothetical protein